MTDNSNQIGPQPGDQVGSTTIGQQIGLQTFVEEIKRQRAAGFDAAAEIAWELAVERARHEETKQALKMARELIESLRAPAPKAETNPRAKKRPSP